jgi:glycosyltransferase involved in cell wall biosynthesis
MRKKKIVVVLPAYNASKTLKKTYENIPKGSYKEIILVDDGSTDRTVKIAKELGIRYFVHEKNMGYGANQKTCFRQALKKGAEIIVMLHPDYQYDPTILPSLTIPIEFGYADVVLASRILGDPERGGALQGGMPLYKFLANKLLTFFQNKLLGMHFSEYHTGYRAYSKEILRKINFNNFSNDYLFDNQILIECIKKKAKFREVPVKTAYFKEASSINFLRSLRYGVGVIGLTLRATFIGTSRNRLFPSRGSD